MLLPLLAALLVAHADDVSTTTTPANTTTPIDVGLRFKSMSLPLGLLSAWVFDEADHPLPAIGATSFGAEFTIEQPTTHWTFYLERFNFHIADGYWDDVEAPPDHTDGDWLEPSSGFGLVAFGANTGQEWALTKKTKEVWLGIGVDGGLGLGIKTGHITQWYSGSDLISDPVADSTCGADEVAYDRATATAEHDQPCGDDGEVKLIPVLPLLDFNLSLSVHIADHAYVRLEGGLHDMPYYGGAIGAHF